MQTAEPGTFPTSTKAGFD